jgi:uncharacterized membrane protein YagU involved in acid resistance
MTTPLALAQLEAILLWGFVATVAMTTILHGSQGLGLSRLSLSFLLGTLLSPNRHVAHVLGFTAYMLGGWVFAFVYFLLMANLGLVSWWTGALIGLLHALFLLVVVLPVLPYIHPRMATEYDGPTSTRRLEPPGFMGLNYGHRTPVTTVTGHVVYGAILGACYPGMV